MAKKNLFVIPLVAVVAIFSLYKLSDYIHVLAVNGSKFPQATGLTDATDDPDHDALTNAQESLWGTDPLDPDSDKDGYKDGEEVASKHNPLLPGPADLLSTTDDSAPDNITDRLSSLIISGIYAGELSDEADETRKQDALTNISTAILVDTTKSLDVTDEILATKVTMSSDSKDAQEKYLRAISYLIENRLWTSLANEPTEIGPVFASLDLANPENNVSIKNYFGNKANLFKQASAEVNALSVPPSWSDIHTQIIATLENLKINHLAISNIGTDPIKALAAMNNIMPSYMSARDLLTSIVQKAKEQHLQTPSGQFWDLVNSLTSE